MSTPILKVKNLSKTFHEQTGFLRHTIDVAANNINFTLAQGETLAIIGENGAGKSTIVKMIAGMIEPSEGEMWVNETKLKYGDFHFRSQYIRYIPQNPEHSFNPRYNIKQLLEMPLKLNTLLTEEERQIRIDETLKQVGLQHTHLNYFPSEMAVGQKQRIALAKALILNPKVIIADELLAMLDISVRSQIINLMLSLQNDFGLSYIYVTQDLGIAKHISDKILVLKQGGSVAEYGNTAEVITSPLSTVTEKLIHGYFGHALKTDIWRDDY